MAAVAESLHPSRGLTVSWLWIGIVASALVLGIATLVLATLPRTPGLSPQAIRTETVTNSSDLNVTVIYEKQISAEYGAEKISSIKLLVAPNVTVSRLDAELFAPNGTLIEQIGDPQIDSTESQRTWTWPIVVRHNGKIGPSDEELQMDIRYALTRPDGPPEPRAQLVTVNMVVQMHDFPIPFYIAMIAIGIISSYLVADGRKIVPRVVAHWGEIKRPLLWIALSLILTPIVYTQFKQTVGSLADQQAIVSLLLALPFGAGLDLGLAKAANARA